MRSQECMQCVLYSCIVDLYHHFSRSLALSLGARALSVPAECQRLAWKAGHKRECVPASASESAAAAGAGSQSRGRATQLGALQLTAQQRHVICQMMERAERQDWRGVVALEGELRAVAALARPEIASAIFSTMGNCYGCMGQYGRAIELHKEHKKIAEEVGDRAGVGRACGNLCKCYAQDGKFDQALTYGNQCYQIGRAHV